MHAKVDLNQFRNVEYHPGNLVKRIIWYVVNVLFFINPFSLWTGLKVFLLRLFGAKVGKGLVIKPNVNIKYPWKLKIGNHVWIGERVWIDNLADVVLEDNVCLSQGAMLLTGNHDYGKVTFDLITADIVIEEGSWIGAHAVVCPGVTCHTHAVLSVNSVASMDLQAYGIYRGNPAEKVKDRKVQ